MELEELVEELLELLEVEAELEVLCEYITVELLELLELEGSCNVLEEVLLLRDCEEEEPELSVLGDSELIDCELRLLELLEELS